MKKNFMMIALASVLMMPVSCTKNEMNAPEDKAPSYDFDLKEMTFDAVPEDGATKTSIDLGTGVVSWNEGDAIKLVWELSKNVGSSTSETLTAENIVEGTASFSVEAPADFENETTEETSRHMYAVYPSTLEVDYSNGSSLYVTVPDVQDGSFANASVSLAKWYYGKPLAFKNLCGLVQVVVADEAVRKIVLEANTDIAGKVDVGGFDGGVVNVKSVKEGKKTITVNVNGAGTYYIAVLPSSLEGFYMALYDEKNELIGDKFSDNTLTVARKQVRKLGTLATGFSDRYYVKVNGKGDGSSWDNAANLSGLKSLVSQNAVKMVYVAAGTYSFSNGNFASNAADAADFSVYGGYSADATGFSLSGRDIVNNATIFDAGHTESTTADKRIWVIQKGTFLFSGITFQNAYRASKADIGSAVILEGAVDVTFNDCIFQNNTNLQVPNEGKLGGGALRLASSSVSVFNECKFLNNTTDYDGGAVYLSATAKATFNGCEFSGNTAIHDGGAVYQTASSVSTFNNCRFDTNEARYGSVISTVGATILDGCYVGAEGRSNTATRGAICMNISAAGKLLIKNSDLSYNTASIGGALYIDNISNTAALEVKSTKFTNNSATSTTVNQGGGAVGVSGDSRAYTGLLEFFDVLFDSNTAYGSGGALWNNGAGVAFTDCSFISNKCTNEAGSAGSGGGAVFANSATAPATKLFFNRCFFNDNDIKKDNWGRHIAIPGTQAYLGLNNCVLRGPFGPAYATTDKTGKGAGIACKCGAVIVNTSILMQVGAPVIARGSTSAERGYSVINSIVMNTPSASPLSFSMSSTSEYMSVYSCIYTAYAGTLSTKYTIDSNSLEGVVRDGTVIPEFNWPYQYNGLSFSVPAPRNTIQVLDWNGSLANNKTFEKQSYSTISNLVQTTAGVGPEFRTWLGNGAELQKDIRGNVRNTAAMWPGSYEDAAVASNAENLNVR